MALHKRGKIWWVYFEQDGQRIQKSTKCSNKRDAERVEAALRTNLAFNSAGIDTSQPKKGPLKMSQALEKYFEWARTHHREKPNTLRGYESAARRWLSIFGNIDVRTITKSLIESKVIKRANERPQRRASRADSSRKVSPATVNRDIAFLKLFFNYLVDNNILDVSPATRIKKLPGESLSERVVTKEEETAYLSEASDTLRDFASILFDTGMRPDELKRLKSDDVNFDLNVISIKTGKTKAARRRINMTQRVATILKRRFEDSGGGLAFVNPNTGKPITTFKTAHGAALRRSQVKPFRLYDARHTFATRFVEASGDIATLKTTLGHSSLQMVMRYAHPTEKHQADCIRRMEAANQG